jgi:bacteriorhodopsin
MVLQMLDDDMPTACTTIEEVGSTGVGALTIAFIILIVVTVVFLAKATSSGEQKRSSLPFSFPFLRFQPSEASRVTVVLTLATQLIGERRYYYCSTYIAGFTALAYFAMLSGQGWTAIAGCRQFFYARYDAQITAPRTFQHMYLETKNLTSKFRDSLLNLGP